MLIQASHLKKSFGTVDVLTDVSFSIKEKEKVALVGRNGCGKSTLIHLLTGQEHPDQGQLFITKGCTIGYLAQISFDDLNQSLWQAINQAFDQVHQVEKRLRALEKELDESKMEEYAHLTETFERLGGYQTEIECKRVLTSFGFDESVWDRALSSFSSGQRTRLALAKLLLSKPDLLLLDEPTNHLDLTTVEWLEGYLKNYPSALLVVSHDRVFLDRVVDKVINIERGVGLSFVGNYTRFLEQKKQYIEKNQQAYLAQQEEMARLQALVDRFHNKKASFAKAKQKQLDRMEKIERIQQDQSHLNIHFSSGRKGGKRVLSLQALQVGYDHPLATIDLELIRGMKVGIVGANGIGKSTLLKTLSARLPALAGQAHYGHQIDVGYFDQESAMVSSDKEVLDYLWDAYPSLDQFTLRSLLARFLFTQDEVFKPVNALSGGERVRLALALLMMAQDNFLLLDEPTNHLDIPSKEALESALMAYDGTLLFVSHDRRFLEKMATHILAFEPEGVKLYEGGYEGYLAGRISEEVKQETEQKETKLDFAQQKVVKNRVMKLEGLISEAEQHLEDLRALRYEPEYYQDFAKMDELNEQIDQAVNELEHLMSEWESKMASLA